MPPLDNKPGHEDLILVPRSTLTVPRTYEGRPLLPGEVPIIPYYAVSAGRSRRDSHRAAAALFDDLALGAAVAAVREDRWQIAGPPVGGPGPATSLSLGGPGPATSMYDPLEDGPTGPVDHAWGESGALIEEWFRTGEVELEAALAEEPAPTVMSLLEALCERVRRVFARPAPALDPG
jgi:hypothetical protein